MISIVVPTYNERHNLEELARRIFASLFSANLSGELIIVDDNSPDKTAEFAQELSKTYKIKVIKRAGKLGLASAVMEGLKQAQNEIVCVMDADLSHPPEAIASMYKVVKSGAADLVIGSRLVEGGGSVYWPWYRKVISIFSQSLARPLTKIKDLTSGFFVFRHHILMGVKLNAVGFKICLEILCRANYNAVLEYPIIFSDRKGGKSKMGAKETFEYLGQLLFLYRDVALGRIKSRG